MGYILFFILLVELTIIYCWNGKNVVSPSFIGCSLFLFSTLMYLVGSDFYRYELHFNTIATIVTLIMCIFLGESFARKIKIKKIEYYNNEFKKETICSNKWVVFILSLFVLVISVSYFYVVYIFSLKMGNSPGNFLTMGTYTRSALYQGLDTVQLPFIISQGVVVTECIVWLCVYCICYNRNVSGKFDKRFMWPIVCYVPQLFANDSRTILLKMISVISIIVFTFTKQKVNWSSKGNRKIVKYAIMVIALFIVVFRVLGYRTGTNDLNSNVMNNIIEYTSAGLVGLDKYLNLGESENTLWGESTLKSVYNIFRQWGMDIPKVDSFEPFYTFYGGDSNIYTTFKAYIHDYGFVGAMLAMVLWGYFITRNIKHIQKNGASFPRMCLVGLMFYGVVMLPIADVTASFLAIATVYQAVYLLILEYVFIQEKVRVR